MNNRSGKKNAFRVSTKCTRISKTLLILLKQVRQVRSGSKISRQILYRTKRSCQSLDFPDPVIGSCRTQQTDVDKLGMSLANSWRRSNITVRTDEGWANIFWDGELHWYHCWSLKWIQVDNQGQPRWIKEALTAKADHREVYKSNWGRGKFADIVFTMEPAEEGKQGWFVSESKGGNVPKEFIPSVEKGFKETLKNGPLAGYEMDSMKITLKDGSFHPVDSDQLSLSWRPSWGINQLQNKQEPWYGTIMKLEVLTPEENMGDIVGDLNRRRGHIWHVW